MAKRLQFRRLLLLVLLAGAAYAGLGYRLVDLQVFRHEKFGPLGELKTHRMFLLEPRRGAILDARGNTLANSVFVKTVCADPSLMGDRQADVARAVAPLLQMRESDLLQRLPHLRQNEQGQTVTNRYVVLKRKVSLETWDKIRGVMASLSLGVDEKKLTQAQRAFCRDLRQKSIFVEPVDDQLRNYPNETLAAHVLGYVGMSEKDVNGRHILETVGMDGIEKTFDSKLAGQRGWRRTETDKSGRELVSLRTEDVEPRDGLNVVLTINSVIQQILESALAEGMEQHSPISISGIVIRPRTGEILAMATLPTFNPNNPGAATPDARRDRIITDIAEPGSTFKIVVVSGGLNDGTVRLTDTFDCEQGHFAFAGKVLHDHKPYGILTVEEIITYSSNIGAAKIGIKMGEARLSEYIRNYGFGARTGIPLPGEVAGIVHPVKNWSKVSIAQIPMGQGISVTRLQMLMTMCAIANKGWLMRPMLVDRLEDPGDPEHPIKYPSQRVRQIISEQAAKTMVQALKTVVSPKGTAPKAALDHYTAAGKTGTAEKVENGVYVKKYFSSFIGFFPADNPELCISVTMDEPKEGYYGGTVAGPIFKQIAENAARCLSIPTEDGAETPATNNIAIPSDNHLLRTAALRSH
jgi:cell division protein FtsI/penicillin-binding protein 2